MKSRLFQTSACNIPLLLLAATLCVLAVTLHAQTQPAQQPPSSAPSQKTFNTPQEAADALIKAADSYDVTALLELLGPDGKDLVSSADAVQDKNRAEAFVAMAHKKNSVVIDPKNKSRATLIVGDDDWPAPIPIVKKKGKWYFDSKQGHDEILYRRIGANELDALQVCRGFVDAQLEYASEAHDDTGVHQYAQKIISTPGKRDGLVWRNDDGTLGGPVGENVAKAIEEGYTSKTQGYHGYYFKVLKGQGPAARLGQLDYVVNGIMIGGFALVAVPAEYRVTGVKTFIVSYDGVVYEKDLGPDSLKIAKEMDHYNPDKTWTRTDDEWPAEAVGGTN
jgi:Protein of unknown function (DUF2950)